MKSYAAYHLVHPKLHILAALERLDSVFCLFLLPFMGMFVVVMPLGADRFSGRVMVNLVPFINVMFKISIKKIVEKFVYSTNLLNQ